MVIILEQKLRTHSIYHRVDQSESGKILSDEIVDVICRTVPGEGHNNYLFFTEDGKLLTAPTDFFRNNMVLDSEATRRQMAHALRLLYINAALVGYDITHMTTTNIHTLIQFLSGITVSPYGDGIRTRRKAETVNTIYAMVRRYILDMNYDFSAFSIRRETLTETNIDGVVMINRRSYDPNRIKTNPQKKLVAPKHLVPEQANNFLKLIKEDRKKNIWLAALLMLRTGMRPGEVLGITHEDVVKEEHCFGSTRYYIILRNRCSDRRDQCCKRLFHPSSTTDYYTKAYHETLRWEIPINKKIYDDLMDYYRESRQQLSANAKKVCLSDSAADCVELLDVDPRKPIPKNWYIFIGENGHRLSGQTLNNHLKPYFDAVGAPVDHGAKETNCAHRLRHSFAMYHAQYSKNPLSPEKLRILMRHTSISSIFPYYTPLPEEILELVSRVQEEMAETIDALN